MRLDQCSVCSQGLNPEYANVNKKGVFCNDCVNLDRQSITSVKRHLAKINWYCPCKFCSQHREAYTEAKEMEAEVLKPQFKQTNFWIKTATLTKSPTKEGRGSE